MATSLSSYASKYILERGLEEPTEERMAETFKHCALPPNEKFYEEIKQIILQEQGKLKG